MANIPGEIVWQANADSWFTTNASDVFPQGITIYHVDGRYKFTDGVTDLATLPFRGDGSGAVESVSGAQVDNTDPLNPIVNTPTLTEVIASDIIFSNLAALYELNKSATSSTTINYSHSFNFFNPTSGSLLRNSIAQLYNLFKGTYDGIYEKIANKQNSLTVDGTGAKYPTVDAINAFSASLDIANLIRQEFSYTSGAQTFTLTETASAAYGVFVNGQELNQSQYTVVGTTLTILDTLVSGYKVNIIYSNVSLGINPSYTKLEVDALLAQVDANALLYAMSF